MSRIRVRYQTIAFGENDIHVKTLRNRQQFSDPGGIASKHGISSANWSLFGVIWASGEILAHLMQDYDIEGKRILEVGCGIGLASLVLNKRAADITATDYHPDAEQFLVDNTRLNCGEEIPFVRADWKEAEEKLGKFDLIIGGDVLYERDKVTELAHFIDKLARPGCVVIIIDPGRKHHAKFSKDMIAQGFSYRCEKVTDLELLTQPRRGCNQFNVLRYER